MEAKEILCKVLDMSKDMTNLQRKSSLALEKYKDALLDGDDKRAEEYRLEYMTVTELTLDKYRDIVIFCKKNGVPVP